MSLSPTRIAPAMVASLIFAAAALLYHYAGRGLVGARPPAQAVALKGIHSRYNKPLSPIVPCASPILQPDSPGAQLVRALVANPPTVPLNGASAAHLLHLYKLASTPREHFSSGKDLIAAMLDMGLSHKYFGDLLIRTRYGARFTLASEPGGSRAGESHRDQCLAEFAEMGLPLSGTTQQRRESVTPQDLLNDSIATFDIHESELTWTAVAYALYIPPTTSWRNRDGKEFTFDELATELLNRPLDTASCGGTHILAALTLLLRVDSRSPILTRKVRNSVMDSLRSWVAKAVESQQSDGSWSLDWNHPRRTRPIYFNSFFYRLLITGHLVEWMEYLPPALQPNEQVYSRALGWLRVNLAKSLQDPDEFADSQFCPWTHAVCALRNLIGDSHRRKS